MKGESSSSFFILFPPIVYALLCTAASIATSAVVPINPFLGIPPQDENYYKTSSPTIKCKDRSATFTKAHLNDDFCDCPDGTDEPGTSACPGGQFYCRNAGHDPVFLFSSRVNDGICDCCDGSDEYDGQVKCPNTCWEAGKVARDKLKKKIATYKEGVALRKREVEKAKMAFAKDVAELSKLKNEEKILKGLVEQLKELKEQIEKTEEKERLQKEKEEKQRKEAEEKANGDKSAVMGGAKLEKGRAEEKIDNEDKDMENKHDEIGVLDDSPAYQDVVDEFADHGAEDESGDASKIEGSPVSKVEKHEGQDDEEPVTTKIKDESTLVPETGHDAGNEVSHPQPMEEEKDESTDAKGLSKEELGRLVGSRWTGNSEKQTEEVRDTKDNDHGDQEEMAHDTHDEKYDGYASETADETDKDDDVDREDDVDETYEEEVHDDVDDAPYKSDSDDEVEFSDTTSPGNPSWLENIQQTFRSILQAFKLFQTPVDKSEAARVRKEYDESSAKLSKIQSRISRLTQKLEHDSGTEKEFYSFYDRCFESKQNKYVYKVCSFKQASQSEGPSTTRLGRWEKFEDSYRVMVFSNGDRCWNGPDRSLKVRLRCGLDNEVTDVDEPSRCEYVALLSTPALCIEGKLKELENKLELMNKQQPRSHDEL
ncbi:PREDICTED: glucosidase 2 subunit beta-like [Populus euphratica]|uniref:Glucosidase 2 subunit beta n=1 Tax=Populus euphratica TaxID=75702 RepID=A0AAJ6VI90_POPEU|nr:PREDICTED: glucosidase 2 subunit beta-like [Populus euphratica]